MANSNITYWSVAQIIANSLGYLMFVGFFKLQYDDAKKAGFLCLFAELSCVGCSAFGLVLSSIAQTTNSSLRRSTDLGIFLYGLYFLFSLSSVGMVFYWMANISNPSVLLMMSMELKQFSLIIVLSHTVIMSFFVRLAWVNLSYLSGYPNVYGIKGAGSI